MANAALVVAHPDDETLWGAGWMLAHPEDRFTVICCSTPKRDPIRAEQFHKACQILGARESIVLPGLDIGGHAPLNLAELPSLDGFDYVITHNMLGEYGNPHHVQVYEHVFVRYPDTRPHYVFGFGIEDWDIELALSPEHLAKKLAALQCYDYATAVDRMPKWQALVNRYFSGKTAALGRETYLCS